ncbi:MAG: hypothetical protein AAF408_05620, partial [Pseudomonadota bacterium]
MPDPQIVIYDAKFENPELPGGVGGGNTVLNGTDAPDGGTGADGDFYIDTTAQAIYGPKASGAWGTATSLIGQQGAAGAQGPAGNDGSDGATGPQGPAGAQGPAGNDGSDGATGPQGATGATGPAGANGPEGADGGSAYDVWIAAGNSGTEQDFLDSLVGAQGPAGNDGSDGATGPQGPAGADGADGAGMVSFYATGISNAYVDGNRRLVNLSGTSTPPTGISFDSGNDQITIGSELDGKVAFVTLSMSVQYDNRSELHLYLETDTGGGWADYETAANYPTRDSNQNDGTTSMTNVPLVLADGMKIRFDYQLNIDGSGTPV